MLNARVKLSLNFSRAVRHEGSSEEKSSEAENTRPAYPHSLLYLSARLLISHLPHPSRSCLSLTDSSRLNVLLRHTTSALISDLSFHRLSTTDRYSIVFPKSLPFRSLHAGVSRHSLMDA
jgi:hypothetical protein